jgi:hypothetical protein
LIINTFCNFRKTIFFNINFKTYRDEAKPEYGLTPTKAIIVTLKNGKESINEIESNLENRVYHDQEGNKGSFFDINISILKKRFDERKKHQTNNFLRKL